MTKKNRTNWSADNRVRLCHTPGCEAIGRRGWAKGFCSSHAQENNLKCTKRLPYTRKTKGSCKVVKHGEAAGEAGGEAGGEVCVEAHVAGSEEAKEAEDQEEAGDEELQCAWFKMCLDIRKRACEETDDVEEDPLLLTWEADEGSETEDEDKPWFDDITTMPEAYLAVYVLDDVHMHGVPWQKQCFTLSPPSGEEEKNMELEAGEGHEEGHPNQQKRFPDCVVVLEDHVIEAMRRAGPVRHRPPQKKSKRASLQGPEQEAEDWVCSFSEEWDLSLSWDQNLSHGL